VAAGEGALTLRRELREGATVAGGMAVLYLLTLTANHTEAEDALEYASGITSGKVSEVLHPHHVLWGALGWLTHNAALALGFGGGALPVLQVQNALTGAIGIGLLWWWLRSIGWPIRAVVTACGVVGFSYGYWFYSGEVEVYVLSATLLVACIAAAHRAAVEPSVRRFAVLGAVNGLAVLAHDTNVLFALVTLAALLISRRGAPWAEVARRGAAYAAVAVAVVVPAYAGAALANGRETPAQAADWIGEYAGTGEWGHARPSSVPNAIVGGGRALVGGHFAFSNDRLADELKRSRGRNPREEAFLMRDFPGWLGVALLVVSAAVAIALAFAAAGTWRARRRLDASQRALALLATCWAIAYIVFFTWWEPLNIEFWVATWVPLALLGGLALVATGHGARRNTILAAVLVGGLALVNLIGSILPWHSEENDYWRVRGQWYEREARPSDLVIANSFEQWTYLEHFTDAALIDVEQMYGEQGGDPRAFVAAVRRSIDDWPGERVLASREAFDPDGDRWSNCTGTGDACAAATILKPELMPGARVIHRDGLETVWELPRQP
jgi:hypothetical protein